MIGEATMVEERRLLHAVPGLAATDPDLTRAVNERAAIICGLADLLIDANGATEPDVARAALDSIKRHATGLRKAFKHL